MHQSAHSKSIPLLVDETQFIQKKNICSLGCKCWFRWPFCRVSVSQADVTMAMVLEPNAYEAERQTRIQHNQQRLGAYGHGADRMFVHGLLGRVVLNHVNDE